MSFQPLLPMEVLGWLAPILAPAEGVGTLRHRPSLLWGLAPAEADQREALWLGYRFPHHAEEALDETREAVFQQGGLKERPSVEGWATSKVVARLDPGSPPHLVVILDHVGRRYLRWSGSQLVVRAGRMEEFHHLALIFPVGQLVHHAHARALAREQVREGRLRELSWQPPHLASGNATLTGLVSRGLAEGHVHLMGISSADEVWADHLLAGEPQSTRRRGDPKRERLLAVLNRLVLRLAALAPLLYHRWRASGGRSSIGAPGLLYLHRLLDRLDELCAISDFDAARDRAGVLQRAVRDVVDEVLASEPTHAAPPGIDWLDAPGRELVQYLLAPGRLTLTHRHSYPRLLRDTPLLPTPSHKRRAAIDWLHLKLHHLLLELPGGRHDVWEGLPARRRWREAGGGRSRGAAQSGAGSDFERSLERYAERVFHRYLVLLTYHHRLGTHRGRRMGLNRFRQHFAAPQRLPPRIDARDLTAILLNEMLADPSLRMVEGRVSPSPGGRRTIRPWLLGLERLQSASRTGADRRIWRRPRKDFAFGLVVHFKKSPEPPQSREHGPLLLPENVPRFHHNRERARRDAVELLRFLNRPDPQVPFVVGIDAAGLELAAPPEVFAPAFRFLREYPIDLREGSLLHWSLIQKRCLFRLVEARRLGMTFHVGEDFRHLLSGLRAVWEAIEFLAARPGDRLGHAIAAGCEPRTWAELLAGQALLPRQEWLDDLVWIWHFLGPGHDLLGELKIEDEIQKHASIIYGECYTSQSPTPLDLHHAWSLRPIDPLCLDLTGVAPWASFPRPGCRSWSRLFRRRLATSPENDRWLTIQRECFEGLEPQQMREIAFRLHWHYLYDPEAQRRGEEMMSRELTQPWLELCREAQDRLRRHLHERHLVIEVNPTSNCAVGPMSGLRDHHVFRITRDREGAPALIATVNTDDPGVFQTSLAHEYFLLGEELLSRNEEETAVLGWLEELRRNGVDYSFLRRLQESHPTIRGAVLDDLRKLYSGWNATYDRWLKEPTEEQDHSGNYAFSGSRPPGSRLGR